MRNRTRLFVLGEWETPVFDTDTSDQPPTDYLLYGPYRELTVMHEIADDAGRVKFRWTGIWSQTSRRKYTEYDHREFLKYLTMPSVFVLPPVHVPEAFARNAPESTEEERRRSLRHQPVTTALADVLVDAGLTLTVDNSACRDGR